MNRLAAVAAWLGDGANWRGAEGVPRRLAEHVAMSGMSVAVAVALAVPAGLALGHARRGGVLAVGVPNAARAVPSFALLVLCGQVFGFDSAVPVVLTLATLAVPPVLTGTHVGVVEVDPAVVDAARGMGLSEWQVLARVELPLALPMVLAGVRTAAVQVVATATLAAALGQGGLGRFIFDGQGQNDAGRMVGGAVLVALLAVATELGLAGLQRAVSRPDGVVHPGRRRLGDGRGRQPRAAASGVDERLGTAPLSAGVPVVPACGG